jgi:hypothetical protein
VSNPPTSDAFTYKPLTTSHLLFSNILFFQFLYLDFIHFFPHPPILNFITLCQLVPYLIYLDHLFYLLHLLIFFVHHHLYTIASVPGVHRTKDPTETITPLAVMMAHERNNRTYELQMAQNPVRARMCGFGEKVI